ncbi:hypothetical protein BN6_12590 [Saccharothrix espanaensis DSM 44229]|uniref:Uncharacterized protein n=1 Tax=Saccharothrix espanaensis (strain ATCC 51144 / DSM 44229 / JCM 9112 / NBRC 15066 / NRRL 15764) TaxID=1179773 RepID=K0JPF0_SACES|nr:hypothetical protein BN6_12590 [Saccharothrix espanaensis DSM 44229]
MRRYRQLGTVARREFPSWHQPACVSLPRAPGLVRAPVSRHWRFGAVGTGKEWQVSCRDIASRRRDMTVFVSQGHVVVTVPPGEAAVLTPLEVGRLRAALRDAVVNASGTPDN